MQRRLMMMLDDDLDLVLPITRRHSSHVNILDYYYYADTGYYIVQQLFS